MKPEINLRSLKGTHLVITVHVSPMFRGRVELAKFLMRMAARVLGASHEVKVNESARKP